MFIVGLRGGPFSMKEIITRENPKYDFFLINIINVKVCVYVCHSLNNVNTAMMMYFETNYGLV